MNDKAHAAVIAFAQDLPELPRLTAKEFMRAARVSRSAHTTHVNVYGVEIEAHYDDTGVLEHAYVTQDSASGLSTVACGPDLMEFLHFSQVKAIEQAISREHERDEQRARFAENSPI